ncbi:MAG: hypothetical protein OXN91_07130 [Chloroflexota bacterium]|nr:hypothetical protein [Chloroflexota bacterium]
MLDDVESVFVLPDRALQVETAASGEDFFGAIESDTSIVHGFNAQPSMKAQGMSRVAGVLGGGPVREVDTARFRVTHDAEAD